MKNRIIILIMALLVMISSVSCGEGHMFEKTYESITQHPGIVPESVDIFAEVSDYAEMRSACVNMIREYVQFGTLKLTDYEGDMARDIEEVCENIRSSSSLGMYALYDMNGRLIRNDDGTYEAEIDIEFSKSVAMIKSMYEVDSKAEIRNLIRTCIQENVPYTVFVTKMRDIDQEYITELVKNSYYESASLSVFAPVSATAVYSGFDEYSIFEITFARQYSVNTLEDMRKEMLDMAEEYTRGYEPQYADRWIVNTAEELGEDIKYVREIGTYDNTKIEYTAYGTLKDSAGTSEGIAMTYKLVCELNDVECEVVIGSRNGKTHCWNIVEMDGERYHVDISEITNLGAMKTILRTDEDFSDSSYHWNEEKHAPCSGTKTYMDYYEDIE